VIILNGEPNKQDKNIYNDKIKHLEFIQAIISRLNHDSFLLKGWTVTLVSAFLGLIVNNQEYAVILIIIIPIIIFWHLDAYYLLMERRFRNLYNDVVNGNVANYSMEIRYYNTGRSTFKSSLFSITIFPLYFIMCFLCCIIYLYLTQCSCFAYAGTISGMVIFACWWQYHCDEEKKNVKQVDSNY
jgi:hypothetical protein